MSKWNYNTITQQSYFDQEKLKQFNCMQNRIYKKNKIIKVV